MDISIKEIVLPEGWEIDKIENNKIILKESKKELPKTWEECANILSVGTVEAAEGKCELEKRRPQNIYAKNSIAMRIGINFGSVHRLKSLFLEITKEPNEILTSSDKLTLGKQDDSTKPTESKSMQLSDVKAKIDAWMVDHTDEEVYEALKKYGAIEDVEEAMIQGWVARDMNGDLVCCAGSKPYKEENIPFWKVDFRNFIECIPNDLFPELTWESEPEEVELIIKRKKNG